MLKTSKKPSVYMVTLQNEKGFTFLTMLVTLAIFCVTIPFTSYLLKSIHDVRFQEEIEIQHFFQFLQDDVFEAHDYATDKNKLHLRNLMDEKVVIEQHDSQIRRRLHGGTEIYLRNVDQLSFKEYSHGIRVHITTERGDTYEKIIPFYP